MEITLGDKLKQLRDLRKLTLRAVEENTGISNGYLNQLEQGKIKGPSPHILHKLAEYYGESYQYLLTLAGYLIPTPGRKAVGIAFSQRKGIKLTSDEEEKLLEYLQFLRQQKGRKG